MQAAVTADKFLRENGAREIAVIFSRQTLVRVSRDSSAAEDDAGVLNPVVGIKQPRADRADLWLQRLAYHFLQPIRDNDPQVVVEQRDEFRLHLADREIIQPAKIEFLLPAQHAHARIALRSCSRKATPPVRCESLSISTQFEIRIASFGPRSFPRTVGAVPPDRELG